MYLIHPYYYDTSMSYILFPYYQISSQTKIITSKKLFASIYAYGPSMKTWVLYTCLLYHAHCETIWKCLIEANLSLSSMKERRKRQSLNLMFQYKLTNLFIYTDHTKPTMHFRNAIAYACNLKMKIRKREDHAKPILPKMFIMGELA